MCRAQHPRRCCRVISNQWTFSHLFPIKPDGAEMLRFHIQYSYQDFDGLFRFNVARQRQIWTDLDRWQVASQAICKSAACIWLLNIAMENDPFIDGLPIKNGDLSMAMLVITRWSQHPLPLFFFRGLMCLRNLGALFFHALPFAEAELMNPNRKEGTASS